MDTSGHLRISLTHTGICVVLGSNGAVLSRGPLIFKSVAECFRSMYLAAGTTEPSFLNWGQDNEVCLLPEQVREELRMYNPEYTARPHIVVLNKMDMEDAYELEEELRVGILAMSKKCEPFSHHPRP